MTSMTDDEARNHGMDRLSGHDERYARAAELITVVEQLWQSWPVEAIVADPAGAYVDESRLRAVGHRGRWFGVAGPLNVPRPPQGRPVLFQPVPPNRGRELAARHAEGIYAVAWDLQSARAYRDDIRTRAAAMGRDPDGIAVMPGLVTYVASTEREARAQQRALNELLPSRTRCAAVLLLRSRHLAMEYRRPGPAAAATGGVPGAERPVRDGFAHHREREPDRARAARSARGRRRACHSCPSCNSVDVSAATTRDRPCAPTSGQVSAQENEFPLTEESCAPQPGIPGTRRSS